jgi:RING finger/CHY zinc finger protein 1
MSSDNSENDLSEDNLSEDDNNINDIIKYSDYTVDIEFKKLLNKKCIHYKPMCKIKVPCCKKYISCIYCHEHEINKNDIKYIMCNRCGCEQGISNKCLICNTIFFKYFCNICKEFTNNEMYHCKECDACVTSDHNGYIHCKKCNYCVERLYYKNHICKDNINDTCCICLEPFIKNIIIAKCGHMFHNTCYVNLIKTSYKCPLCSKSIKDMTKEFNKLDNNIKKYKQESTYTVNIICNDCNKKTEIEYNELGLKCENCLSYNTYII